jgi:hypothetical protein
MFWAFKFCFDVGILAFFGYFFQKLGNIFLIIWSHCCLGLWKALVFQIWSLEPLHVRRKSYRLQKRNAKMPKSNSKCQNAKMQYKKTQFKNALYNQLCQYTFIGWVQLLLKFTLGQILYNLQYCKKMLNAISSAVRTTHNEKAWPPMI